MSIERRFTPNGFVYGVAKVSCLHAWADTTGRMRGRVWFGIKTERVDLQVHVTRTGFVRIVDSKGREWKPTAPKERDPG